MDVTRDAAWALLTEFTTNENLLKHALAVEAAVRHYAAPVRRGRGGVAARWRCSTTSTTSGIRRSRIIPSGAREILRERGWPEWVDARGPLARRPHEDGAARRALEHTLFACDEMAGFVTAASLVRPSKSVLDLEASSVVKRMKDKAFARAVSRDDLRRGGRAELGLPLADHITQRDCRSCASRRTRWGSGGAVAACPDSGSGACPAANRRRLHIVYLCECPSPPATPVVALNRVSVALRRELRPPRGHCRRFPRAPSACWARTAPARARSSRPCSASSPRPRGR